jgi:hypothetical protein
VIATILLSATYVLLHAKNPLSFVLGQGVQPRMTGAVKAAPAVHRSDAETLDGEDGCANLDVRERGAVRGSWQLTSKELLILIMRANPEPSEDVPFADSQCAAGVCHAG